MKIDRLNRCDVCDGLYRPSGYNQKFCIKCKPIRTQSRVKVCDMCGKPFTDHSRYNNTKYCSDRCRRLIHNEQAANWISKVRMDKLWEQMK